jgi:hypothetical protein
VILADNFYVRETDDMGLLIALDYRGVTWLLCKTSKEESKMDSGVFRRFIRFRQAFQTRLPWYPHNGHLWDFVRSRVEWIHQATEGNWSLGYEPLHATAGIVGFFFSVEEEASLFRLRW